MKKRYLLALILLFFPFICVNAEGLKCYDKDFDLSECEDSCNFTCSGITGNKVTFTHNGEDYSKYFKLSSDKKTIEVDKSITFDSNYDVGIIVISDGKNSFNFRVKNTNYKPTTASTTTTTTKDPNMKEITVTLNPNDGADSTTKTCSIPSGSDTCAITLPTLDVTGFNGWGTASTCKEGNSGAIKVDKDTTYYACYSNRDNEDNASIYLNNLEIYDKAKNEKIRFGTFSRRKNEYDFKVLYEVENLDIRATAEEGITVEITGGENLVVGENEIIIKLTNENNETNEYKLKVTRLKEGEKLDFTHYLKSLVIGGYKINFNKSVFNYTVTIPNDVNKLEISAEPENEEDTKTVKNNENLVNGSKVLIEVTGEDKEVTTYTINIIKENKMNYILIIVIGGIILIIIILIIIIIIKSNKNNKKKKKTKIEPETLKNNNKNKNDIEILNI